MITKRVLIGLWVAAALSMTGCTGTSAKTAATTAGMPAATSVAIGDGKTLRGYLIPPDSKARSVSVPESTFGVQTPQQYADDDFNDPTYELAKLTGAGLAVVAATDWTEPSGDEVHAKLLQFHTSDGATANLISQEKGDADDGARTDAYPITGYVEGHGYEFDGPDSEGNRSAVLLGQDGSLALIVFFYTKNALDRSAETAFFQKQFAALHPSDALPPLPATTTQVRKPLVPKAPASVSFGDGAALKKRLVSFTAVKTYVPKGSTDGIFTVDQFAGLNTNSATVQHRLQSLQLGVVAANDLLNADGAEVITRLLQFRTSAEATSYYASDLKSRLADGSVGQSFPLIGAAHAYGIEYPNFNDYGNRIVGMLYVDGPVCILIDVDSPGQLDWLYDIKALQSQIDALASS